ncbi:MAG: enoyl-CoA hydratase/isomerase family protein [Acidimicrobiia bacterium]
MPTGTGLRFELAAGVARLTLDRPPANALDGSLARALRSAALRCDEDPDIRAVILSGAGSTFCSGGDVKAFAESADELPSLLKDLTTDLHAAVSRFTRMNAPVVAAVHGHAAGAGMSLVCAADLAIAADTALFTLAYGRIGLSPDGSSTYFLPRLIGMRRTMELALTNRTLSAVEALDWGIVTRVVPEAELSETATALAESLASGPTLALGGANRLYHAGWNDTLESQMELEARTIADMGRTADGREGIAAFVAKRRPKFLGR